FYRQDSRGSLLSFNLLPDHGSWEIGVKGEIGPCRNAIHFRKRDGEPFIPGRPTTALFYSWLLTAFTAILAKASS
ncbi:MAG: hypothetical protein ACOC93_00455, partial [Planctomycetota bacterium]